MSAPFQPGMDFDGKTYEPLFDKARLNTILGRVWNLMRDHEWRTLSEIKEITGGSEASVSARLRDLRKERFGSLEVERRRRGPAADGLWEYRIRP